MLLNKENASGGDVVPSFSILTSNYTKMQYGHSIIYSTQLQNTSASYDPVIHYELDHFVVTVLTLFNHIPREGNDIDLLLCPPQNSFHCSD